MINGSLDSFGIFFKLSIECDRCQVLREHIHASYNFYNERDIVVYIVLVCAHLAIYLLRFRVP